MITEVLSRYGVSHTFVDMTNLEEIKQNIKPNTKLFYVETPSNPLLKVTDIREVSKLAKSIGALTFVDNTFLTPLFQNHLNLELMSFFIVLQNLLLVIVMLLPD